MLPLFDLMMQAQNGKALEAFSRQYGVAQEQMQAAISALLPAFSAGFRKTATSPYDFGALMSAMTSGNYARYFEDLNSVFSPQGLNDGNNILGTIFGSKEVSRAIAAQAAQMSGISQDLMKQMMPALANTMMGGFFRQMSDQFQKAGEGFMPGANLVEQWMQASGLKEKPKEDTLFDNAFTRSVQSMFDPQKQQEQAASLMSGNPFMSMFAAAGKTGEAGSARQQAGENGADAFDAGAMTGLFGQMFEAGVEVQKNYQKSLEQILDTYRSATPEKK